LAIILVDRIYKNKNWRFKMKKIKVKVGIDKSKLIKSEKKIVACGKNF